MTVTVSAAVYNYVRFSAFCFIEHSGNQITVLQNIFMADRTRTFYAGLALRPAGRTAVYVAQLVWCSSGRTEDF